MNYFKWRGVIEGFYGKPWTLAERLDCFRFMAENNYNVYVYAPKDDPYHRVKWAEPYPPSQLEEFQKLVDGANNYGITFTFAISPGLTIDYSSEEHFKQLVDKCSYLIDVGVGAFGLFFDDIPKEPTTQLAIDQARLANRLYQAIRVQNPGIELMFCPTKYQGDGKHPYVTALGAELIEDIAIFWTGPYVCSPRLDASDAQSLAETLRRPVLYWDNYPVNDASMYPELHIGPYINRDPKLYHHCLGIVANPMNLAESSKIALATIGNYLMSPEQYQAEQAWQEAIAKVCGHRSEDFLLFAEANLVSPIHPEEPPLYVQAVANYSEGLNNFDFQGSFERLDQFFDQMLTSAAKIRHLPNQKLIREVDPWLSEFKQWAELGKLAVNLKGRLFQLTLDPSLDQAARTNLREELKEARNQLGQALKDAVDWETKVCGQTIRHFAQDVYQTTKKYLG